MAAIPPPWDCPSADGPKTEILPAGTVWWRIHEAGSPAGSFRDTGAVAKRADPVAHGLEGRFDCQMGEYGCLYLGETRRSTIAEAFLRGPVVANPSARFMGLSRASGRVLSRVELTTDVRLVDLRGAAGLGRLGQDAWLTACDEADYPTTQEWATAIRRWAPDAGGLLWMPKRDNLHAALVLFSDRVDPGALAGRSIAALDDPLGITSPPRRTCSTENGEPAGEARAVGRPRRPKSCQKVLCPACTVR